MTVSPDEGGNAKVDNYTQTKASKSYTKSFGSIVKLEALPAKGYEFDRWGGAINGTINPSYITLNFKKSVAWRQYVTLYFIPSTEDASLQKIKNLIDSKKDVLVIDVSSPNDYIRSHILCAKKYTWSITTGNFDDDISGLNSYKDDDVLVYDHNGTRSKYAADYLIGQGFTSVSCMTNGLDDWIAEGYETFTTAEDSDICTSLSPMAYAGTDQHVNENVEVTLIGSGSDPDGGAITYSWTQALGTNVTLSNSTVDRPTFTSPTLSGSEVTLIFHLTVTDDENNKDTDDITVTVGLPNALPTAIAGEDQTIKKGETVILDGSGSTDSDGTIANYSWIQTDDTGIAVTLSDSSAMKPTFTAPDVETATTLTFTLSVIDDDGSSATDEVQITVIADDGGGGGGCFITSAKRRSKLTRYLIKSAMKSEPYKEVLSN